MIAWAQIGHIKLKIHTLESRLILVESALGTDLFALKLTQSLTQFFLN